MASSIKRSLGSIAASTTLTCGLLAGQAAQEKTPVASTTTAQVPKPAVGQAVDLIKAAPAAKVQTKVMFGAVPAKGFVAKGQVIANNAAVLKNAKTRFERQFRPLFMADLIHARNLCHLSTEQLRQIRPQTEQAFDEFVTQYSQSQTGIRIINAQRAGIPRVQMREAKVVDVVAELQSTVAGIVKKFVSPELFTAYEADIKKRHEATKNAGVDMILSMLDRDLLLSSVQHAKVADALKAHWQDSWVSGIDLAVSGNDFYPDISDELIAPILSDAQKNIWQRKSRATGSYWGGAFIPMNGAGIEEALGGPAATKPAIAKPAATKPADAKPAVAKPANGVPF
jgi:hypothetical protein